MYINEAIRIINEAKDQDKLVIFIGAGVSMNSGFPSWTQLITNYATALEIKKDSFSPEEYLKIPQYYYNKFKKTEYFKIINNQFNVSLNPNPIHKLIFDLQPSQIITTNFDDLLEKANDEYRIEYYGLIYDTIKQDSDIPHSLSKRNIIKMHGDLKLRNIVLKEDDYLSYSQNFPLIETYIKSIIATNTILFIGYSHNDPDVKLIFQWVKDLLGGDVKRAFYIYIPKNSNLPFEIENEYYSNRGIHLLNYSDFDNNILDELKKTYENELKELSSEEGKNLYLILKYILDKKNYIFTSIIDKYCNYIEPYRHIKAIRKERLEKILNISSFYELKYNELIFYENSEIHELIKKFRIISDNKNQIDSEEIIKLKDIISFFIKFGATSIRSELGKENIKFDFAEIIKQNNEFDFVDDIYLFCSASMKTGKN